MYLQVLPYLFVFSTCMVYFYQNLIFGLALPPPFPPGGMPPPQFLPGPNMPSPQAMHNLPTYYANNYPDPRARTTLVQSKGVDLPYQNYADNSLRNIMYYENHAAPRLLSSPSQTICWMVINALLMIIWFYLV
ncbi:hypothetical protein HMI54_003791 [Coelomomyces lativittatus]|nr:hypothetical protein HMI55_003258 [Coelomomyces lativittatus]KAJ1510601.1 hypothetical protein HMI56_006268 [Coelomomyces lativittatus]KAJ1517841.1 hypothetical protein HMI54_003791 [Coelomomyces lativittatus]